MRLIDADALRDSHLIMGEQTTFIKNITWNDLYNAPTIDAEPVKHGHWVGHWENDSFCLPGEYRCSACGGKAPGNLANNSYIFSDYCPYCGAKMDEVVSNEK